MKRQRWAPLLAAATVLVVAGCGSSTKSANSPTTTSGSASPSTTAVTAGSTSPGSTAPATTAQAAAAADVPSGPVTITVNCEPPTTQAALRKNWTDDVASFEKKYPNIKIVSEDENPCDDPNTFDAKLASGQEENVFYVYFTDVAHVIASGQAADIEKYASSVPNLGDVQPSITNLFRQGSTASGDLFGLPRTNYTMGLLYNRTLFQQAGLDPNQPPTTWAQVEADAKKISALGNGIVGYGDYSAGNTGGWHFTAEMYSYGHDMVTPDGKSADFNNATGLQVLNNLKTMRWTDNVMGSKQLLQYNDLLQMMASGKLGMYIAAPDNVTAIHTQYNTPYSNLGMGPMPEEKGTLLGGDGYMFNVKDTPDQIKAGLLWLEYENLTPGQGQFNYARNAQEGQPVGLPEPDLWEGPTATADAAAKAKYANIPTANFAQYIAETPKIQGFIEPPDAQAIYKVMDGAMSAILTNQNANPQQVLTQYTSQVNSVLAANS
jgi:multiple sugar transport system substrate-binding protein